MPRRYLGLPSLLVWGERLRKRLLHLVQTLQTSCQHIEFYLHKLYRNDLAIEENKHICFQILRYNW